MKAKLYIAIPALLAAVIAMPAQAKAKPKPQQTPPPPVAGSCTPNGGIWNGHCYTVPPINKPVSPTKPKGSK